MTRIRRGIPRDDLYRAMMLLATIACTETVATVLPEPPDGVVASLQSRAVVALLWSPRPPNENVVAYTVYRDGLRLGESASTSFLDTSPPELKTHSYSVASRSREGIISQLSASASIFAPDASAPRVLTTVPPENAINVDPFLTLTIFFSEPLDPSSVRDASVSVSGAGNAIPGAVTYVPSNNKIQWKALSQVALDLRVSAVISGVKDTAGNAMSPEFSFGFTTRGTTPPRVTGFIPPDGSTNVSFYTQPIVIFSQPMKTFTFQIEALNGLPPVTVAAIFDASKQRATLRPVGTVYPLGTYRISIPATVTDSFGIQIVDRPTFTFTYGTDFSLPKVTSTSPPNAAVNVDVQPFVMVQLDRPIVKVGDYQVALDIRKSDGTPVSGTFVFQEFGSAVWYGTLSRLAPQTRYVVSATQSYTDPSGNRLNDVYAWSFTTGG